ncbi:MAG: hypothetical protein AAFV93_22075 [Chloroflexota bacterium]
MVANKPDVIETENGKLAVQHHFHGVQLTIENLKMGTSAIFLNDREVHQLFTALKHNLLGSKLLHRTFKVWRPSDCQGWNWAELHYSWEVDNFEYELETTVKMSTSDIVVYWINRPQYEFQQDTILDMIVDEIAPTNKEDSIEPSTDKNAIGYLLIAPPTVGNLIRSLELLNES